MQTTLSLFDSLPMMPKPAHTGPADPLPENKIQKPLYVFVIEGEPVPKARPRTRIVKPKYGVPFIHHYQPAETEKYEQRIKAAAQLVMKDAAPLDDCPIGLLVRAYISIPDSWSQKKKCAALRDELRPLSRPDHDNYLKIASDALNGVAYRDDSLITDSHQIKRYSDRPRLEIEVYV